MIEDLGTNINEGLSVAKGQTIAGISDSLVKVLAFSSHFME